MTNPSWCHGRLTDLAAESERFGYFSLERGIELKTLGGLKRTIGINRICDYRLFAFFNEAFE